jgi:hypothetical protein
VASSVQERPSWFQEYTAWELTRFVLKKISFKECTASERSMLIMEGNHCLIGQQMMILPYLYLYLIIKGARVPWFGFSVFSYP